MHSASASWWRMCLPLERQRHQLLRFTHFLIASSVSKKEWAEQLQRRSEDEGWGTSKRRGRGRGRWRGWRREWGGRRKVQETHRRELVLWATFSRHHIHLYSINSQLSAAAWVITFLSLLGAPPPQKKRSALFRIHYNRNYHPPEIQIKKRRKKILY